MYRKIHGMTTLLLGLLLSGCATTDITRPENGTGRIISFGFSTPLTTGTINDSTHTISIIVPSGTTTTTLKPTINHTGTKIDPDTDAVVDFTGPVTFKVTAADGSTQAYTVILNVAGEIAETLQILFLGNSITHSGPAPDYGWYGNWGMAASSEETDFVHVLMHTLSTSFPKTSFTHERLNLVPWEHDFSKDLSSLSTIKIYPPDILIVRIGDNVPGDYAKSNNYSAELTKMINFFIDSSTKVIITGNFFPDTYKDSVQQSVALVNNWQFIDLKSIAANEKNHALGLFDNFGVADHPSDAGMKEIALSLYFKILKILFAE